MQTEAEHSSTIGTQQELIGLYSFGAKRARSLRVNRLRSQTKDPGMNNEDEFHIVRVIQCPHCHAYTYRVTFTILPNLRSIYGRCASCGIEGHTETGNGRDLAVASVNHPAFELPVVLVSD